MRRRLGEKKPGNDRKDIAEDELVGMPLSGARERRENSNADIDHRLCDRGVEERAMGDDRHAEPAASSHEG